jgi:hypothetical protein
MTGLSTVEPIAVLSARLIVGTFRNLPQQCQAHKKACIERYGEVIIDNNASSF